MMEKHSMKAANFSTRALARVHAFTQRIPKTLVVAATATTLLAACGISPQTTPDGRVAFPDPSRAWLHNGTFVNVANLRQMRVGLSKNQVYALLEEPHFNEGVIAVHVWNYIFNFTQPDGAVVQCQYQVQYDNHSLVKGMYWRDERCADLLNARIAPPAPAPVPVQEVERVNLSGDVSFDTDRAVLKPIARAKLDSLINRSGDATYSVVIVAGYTDSRGSAQHNQGLSERRAASVVTYLREHGLKAQRYEAHGYGESGPIASNATAEGRAQNRRVEITLEP
jgi:outer membrane protein OmpA-like peptidoglycan-associated protein